MRRLCLPLSWALGAMKKYPAAPQAFDKPEFQRTLTLVDAYQILYRFIEQYHARGESSTAELLADLSLDVWEDGGSTDPVQLKDFLEVANEILDSSKYVT